MLLPVAGVLSSWEQCLPVGISHCGCVFPPCQQESISSAWSQRFKGSPDEARPTHVMSLSIRTQAADEGCQSPVQHLFASS